MTSLSQPCVKILKLEFNSCFLEVVPLFLDFVSHFLVFVTHMRIFDPLRLLDVKWSGFLILGVNLEVTTTSHLPIVTNPKIEL